MINLIHLTISFQYSANDEIMRGDYANKSPDLRFAYADVNYNQTVIINLDFMIWKPAS